MLKKILWGILVTGVIGGAFAYYKYLRIMSPNVPEKLENNIVIIPTNSSFNDVVEILYKNNCYIQSSSLNTTRFKYSTLFILTRNTVSHKRYNTCLFLVD